jgi:hypothetical protein
VLDELSYRQVYEHRYPGLELPAFDKLTLPATTSRAPHPAITFIRLYSLYPSLLPLITVTPFVKARQDSSRSNKLHLHGHR